jgi:hypothetical protein
VQATVRGSPRRSSLSDDDVFFVVGERRLRLTNIEATEIYSRAVMSSLPARTLHSELQRAKRSEPGQREVEVSEQIRQELLLILDAVELDDLMTPGLRELRDAARTPL